MLYQVLYIWVNLYKKKEMIKKIILLKFFVWERVIKKLNYSTYVDSHIELD